ncbi:MAG: DUF2939 domain-containing protein [Proteobacteria bacterium]|nr:DUF2939 domain-containing protein [Pseudomonadota bacterium]
MNNKIKIYFLLTIAILSTWLFFTPHLAVNSMKSAAEARDVSKLASYVDFPAFKESLKMSINATVSAEVDKKEQEGVPFATLGAAMVMAFVDPLIDELVSPEGLAMMMKGEKPNLNEESTNHKTQSGTDISMSYDDINRFIVAVKKKDEAGKPLRLIFSRDGIFSWKLTAVDLGS